MKAVRIIAGAALVAAFACTAPSWGKEKPKDPASRAAAFDKVAACRTIKDPAARLACFDNTVAALEAAEKSGDVVVVDRAQIHEAKKQVFGLPAIESLNIFNRGEHTETVEKITGEIARATQGYDQKWVIETKDGQVWAETDVESFYPEPKAGDHVEIRKGVLGSFFIKINNNVSFKVHRDK